MGVSNLGNSILSEMILNLKSDSTYSRIVQISLIFFIINLDTDMSRHESWINCASKASGCVGFGSMFDSVD